MLTAQQCFNSVFEIQSDASINILRGTSTWIKKYLSAYLTNKLKCFRLRFIVPCNMFHKILKNLIQFNPGLWGVRFKAANRAVICTEIKVVVCLRYIGTGISMNDLDNGCKMGTETLWQYLINFCREYLSMHGVIYYNRRPGLEERGKIEDMYRSVGFWGLYRSSRC